MSFLPQTDTITWDLERWAVLTRAGAEASWRTTGVGRIIATYALGQPDARQIDAAKPGRRIDQCAHAAELRFRLRR